MSYLQAFSMLVERFLEELSVVFPEEKSLRTYHKYATQLLALQPRLALRYFCEFVMPYRQQIEAEDESFFLQKDYSAEEFGGVVPQQDMLQAIHMKELWRSMSPASRSKTWKYLQNMITAAEKA